MIKRCFKMIPWFEKHNKLSWLLAIITAIAIFFISSLPAGEISPFVGFNWQTTAYHIAAFFFLAFFLLPAIVKGNNKTLILFAIIIAVLYGVSDEFHQLFVPGRHFSILDMLTNSFGILTASFIYTLSLRYRKEKHKILV